MKALFQTLTFSILLSFGSLLAYACSCDVPSQRREFKDADAVFVGEVLEFKERAAEAETNEDLILFPYQVTFKIEKQWKGERQSQIITLTDSAIGPCGGFDVTVGDRFIIYAQRKSGQLTFWRACFRNRKADDAKDEIKKLGKFFRADAFLYPKFWKKMFENDDTANKSLDARQKQPLFKIYFG